MSNKGMKINVSLRDHQAALRRLGFARTWSDRDAQQYEREYAEDEVTMKVQLWRDGGHRVSYAHASLMTGLPGHGCETTTPVDFQGVPGMLRAIEQQRKHWLAGEKEVEVEYTRRDYSVERDVIREELRQRAVNHEAYRHRNATMDNQIS